MISFIHKLNRKKIYLLFAILGSTGIIGVFLPFTWKISPIEVIFDRNLWEIASPTLLSFFIFIFSVRIFFLGQFTKAEKIIAYILGALSSFITFSFIPIRDIFQMSYYEMFAIAIGVGIILLGTFFVLKNLKKKVLNKYNSLIAIQIPYIANCFMCLVIFRPDEFDWDIGAYFCLTASIVYIVQIALFITHKEKIE